MEVDRIWCNKDACGILCVAIMYILVCFGDFTVCVYILGPCPGWFRWPNTLLFNLFVGMALWSHLASMLSDPGSVPIPTTETLTSSPLPTNSDSNDRNSYKIHERIQPLEILNEGSAKVELAPAAALAESPSSISRVAETDEVQLHDAAVDGYSRTRGYNKVPAPWQSPRTEPTTGQTCTVLQSLSPPFSNPLSSDCISISNPSSSLHQSSVKGLSHRDCIGAANSVSVTVNPVIRECHKCRCVKPQRAFHCSVCKRCIIKMDHHCPWINNCVGGFNQKFFLLFLFYISLISNYALVGLCLRAGRCIAHASDRSMETYKTIASAVTLRLDFSSGSQSLSRLLSNATSNPSEDNEENDPKGGSTRSGSGGSLSDGLLWVLHQMPPVSCDFSSKAVICLSLIFMEAIIFSLFTLIISCEQISSILSNCTRIESLKGIKRPHRSYRSNLTEVFGESFRLSWFIPMKPKCN